MLSVLIASGIAFIALNLLCLSATAASSNGQRNVKSEL